MIKIEKPSRLMITHKKTAIGIGDALPGHRDFL
ncbi:hypothetical protein JOD44_002199 [Salimicrobium jeotgali]|nr:hypothetical protein [Salimicrobium jeotgali]